HGKERGERPESGGAKLREPQRDAAPVVRHGMGWRAGPLTKPVPGGLALPLGGAHAPTVTHAGRLCRWQPGITVHSHRAWPPTRLAAHALRPCRFFCSL